MNSTIVIISTVGLILLAAIVIVAMREDKKKDISPSSKCGCGNTKNPDGNCDGSHNDLVSTNAESQNSGSVEYSS